METIVSHRLAMYELSHQGEQFVVTDSATPEPFDILHYSEFKYGHRDHAERFGTSMAHVLIRHFTPILSQGEQIVVIGTPYKRVPNAARMLAITAERTMRASGLPSSYRTIYQHRLAEGDYGTLALHDRIARNAGKQRYVDPEDFSGKHVVLIDDVRITGSIEQSIVELLSSIPVLSMTIVNLVKLDASLALERPHLEDTLNHAAIHDLLSLLDLMRSSDFVLTTRAAKFILEAPLANIELLLLRLTRRQLTDLYEAIVDEGYDLMPRYAAPFEVLQREYFHRPIHSVRKK